MLNLQFSTSFDHNFLPRGLVLYRSLKKHCPEAELHVLCLSDECLEYLKAVALPALHFYSLQEIESFEPRLEAAKKDRRRTEYFFTLTPIWQLFLFDRWPSVGLITCIDADSAFFSDPSPVLRSMDTASVAIVGHKFPARLKHIEDHGIYNQAFESFRRDETGFNCLNWWADKCLDWCHDYLDGDRYADQKYLDQWPKLFGAVALAHKGVNVGPFNVDNYIFTVKNGCVFVDDDPLVFFHFANLRQIGMGWVDSGFNDYKSRMTPVLRNDVYKPYVAELNVISGRMSHQGIFSTRALRGKSDSAVWAWHKKAVFRCRQTLKHCQAILTGSAISA